MLDCFRADLAPTAQPAKFPFRVNVLIERAEEKYRAPRRALNRPERQLCPARDGGN